MTPKTDNWITAIVGLWLFFTPWFFADTALFASSVASNFWIVGGAIAIISFFALQKLQVWEEGLNLVLGIWMVLSPWILGFSVSRPLMWNALIGGLLVVGFAGAALPAARRAEAV